MRHRFRIKIFANGTPSGSSRIFRLESGLLGMWAAQSSNGTASFDFCRLLSATLEPTVNESIVHLSVAFWLFPPHDDGLLWNRQKCEAAMEPTLFHRILQSVITRGMRKVASLVRSIKVHPQIAVYGSQRMCRSCGAITARSKPFCLECGELLPAV